MKELSAIEKLEFVKETFDRLGLKFDNVTVAEAFDLFNRLSSTVSNALINKIECGECDGCGEVMEGGGDWMECSLCNGTGEIIKP